MSDRRGSIRLRLLAVIAGGGLIVAAIWYQSQSGSPRPAEDHDHAAHDHGAPLASTTPKTLKLSKQARENLGLISRPIRLQSYWRTILVPGQLVDRPGITDRGVTAPIEGVVSEVHAFPGDTVRPGDRLITLKLVSESVQQTQADLFKARRESEIARETYDRLSKLTDAIPQSKLIEADQQLRRLQASVQSHRQDLSLRGLDAGQLDRIERGQFVSSIEVTVPIPVSPAQPAGNTDPSEMPPESFEVQHLQIDLGTQVQAGQSLVVLANHHRLYIAGQAFKREAPALERAAQRNWPIQIEFAEDDATSWPAIDQVFSIHHLANMIDSTSRTFDFFVPLVNQSRSFEREGKLYFVWRFRPGQRVKMYVPVEEFQDVIVIPSEAVVKEGPEAYVFRQNGDLFDRFAVHVLHEDRRHVVISNDGSVAPGWYLAQGSAASLNRVLKAQSSSGTPAGFHVHADGSVHGAH